MTSPPIQPRAPDHDVPAQLNTGTRAVPEQHLVDVVALEGYLSQQIEGFQGGLSLQMFKGGQSNPTYLLTTPSQSYVMRAKPGPVAKLLPSAHAVEREFRVMKALTTSEVPVPKMLLLCEDESLIGRAFYVMEHMQGHVFWDQALPTQSTSERSAIYWEMNRVLAALHRIDPIAIGLEGYGKPGSYFERQIKRWSQQYEASITQPIEAMNKLMDWLPRNMPASAKDESKVSIVHGDYRLDNLMFAADHAGNGAQICAVLDWELSTLGHPLADFSYHCLSWHIPPGTFRGIGGMDHQAMGIPPEADYIARYCEQTQIASAADLRTDWNFYLAYNLFRLAAILQGIAKRIEAGTASSAQAVASAAGAKPLADLAWAYAQKA